MVASIVERIFENARAFPDKVALIDGTEQITYNQLCGKIITAKSFLETKGLQATQRIVISASKEVGAIYGYFASHLLGAIPVPLDPQTQVDRLQLITSLSGSKAVIWKGQGEGNISLEDLAGGEVASLAGCRAFPQADDTSDILFTSGTTGQPKGVVLTHANHLSAAQNINQFIGNSEDDVELLALPLSHSFGLGRLRCMLSLGGTLVLVNGFSRVKRIFKAIEKHGVTGMGLVPAAWNVLYRISKDYIRRYADQLRYIEIGSSPMELGAKHALMGFLPKTRICMHYGLTEASRAAFIEFHTQKNLLDTIGQASPNVTITIRDEAGTVLESGCEGEICVDGGMVMQSYWEDPNLTVESFWGRTFRTGDRGAMDANGFIRLIGREKEMINVGGRKVIPIEIEEKIKNIKGIADCACIGVPDTISGEAIKAFIVAEDAPIAEEDILHILRPQMETYKIPQSFEWIDRIPYMFSGKVQRSALEDLSSD
mgnify:FL=1